MWFGASAIAGDAPPKPAQFDLTANCAAALLAGAFASEQSRTRLYQELDGSYLVTLSIPASLWDIPLRRYTRLDGGGFQVTYYFDPNPGPTRVNALPYFRSIDIRPDESRMSLQLDDESDVVLVWDEYIKAFELTPEVIDKYIEQSSHRLLATDSMEPHEMGHFLAIAYSDAGGAIIKKGIPGLEDIAAENFCAEARTHLFAEESFGLTRDFDDPDETNFVMLRLSLVRMREFHFKEEADARANALLRAIGCPE